MRRLRFPRVWLVSALLAGCLASRGAADTPGEAEQLFRQRVLPLFKQKCFACHGDDAKKRKGGLDLRTRAGLLRGGDSGTPALTPGEPEKSPLYVAVTRRDPDLVMPPKDNDKLAAEQVEWVRRWVAGGAPWPAEQPAGWTEDTGAGGVLIATSGGRTPEWTNRRYRSEDVWAYRPVRQQAVPAADGNNPIDAFLRQKLSERGVAQTAPPADRRTLLRRVTFDLTGLPPTPAELDGFLRDDSPDAFARVVERLLASPHYGEQMARHWLDVVRYADTSGFANDYERPNAWRYRDYVVRSFNADKPYDRFVLEQLAGDELAPDDPEMLVAVGFLRMGPWEQTGMSVAVVTRQHFLDDVTHAVGVTFLGQGLRCCQCHDHKFDPIPTRDYYRMQAAFAPVQLAERELPFLPCENTAAFAEGKAVVERRLQAARDAVARLRQKSEQAIAEYLKARGVKRFVDLPENERPNRQRYGLSKLELSLLKVGQKRIEALERELNRYRPLAFSIYNGVSNNYSSNKPVNPPPARRDGPVQEVRILVSGSLEAPAEPVTPGALSAVAGTDEVIPTATDGRRLALARWIASPQNPFTARVIVNRVWQMHFGKGLVATPNNFGKMGKRPTYPELLDWLAGWFVEHGWSLKQLHRLIVSSAAYRQGGDHPDGERLRQLDPNNDLLAYFPPRRLAAEEIRDSLLAVSDELNRAAGGPGAFPEINWEVALQPRHVMGSVAPAYQPSPTLQQRHRRTLYTFRIRTLSDPMLDVFNRPGSETSCERRDETTVAPQVFALFNGEFAHDRTLALAVAVEKHVDPIAELYRRCYGRDPTADEIALCREHLARMTAYHREHPPTPTELPTRVRRRMVEEMTGEEFEWDEELDGLVNYQRDLKPWQVGPETRALADLCLVVMNSNEFLYIR
jgi:mono/diheme cytochrome c family protein